MSLPINTFKFRAECASDIQALSMLLKKKSVSAKIIGEQDEKFPDCVAVIKTNLELERIREIMGLITDGHVMSETVRLESNYDGIRNGDCK